MRLLPIILVLPLLNGCVAFPCFSPYTAERSAAVSGTLLDEQTRTPVSGAEVFFALDPELRSKSDKNGRFAISATRYHYWIVWNTLGGESKSWDPPLAPEITVTHTNWATLQIHWNKSPQTVLLQRLPEPSVVRPWMTFDGNGVITKDGGAVRYLASRPVMAIPGVAPGPILIRPYADGMHRATNIPNGALLLINVPFKQKVYALKLTVLRGPARPRFSATPAAGFSWSFWPSYDRPSNQIRVEDTSYVYRLEFIR